MQPHVGLAPSDSIILRHGRAVISADGPATVRDAWEATSARDGRANDSHGKVASCGKPLGMRDIRAHRRKPRPARAESTRNGQKPRRLNLLLAQRPPGLGSRDSVHSRPILAELGRSYWPMVAKSGQTLAKLPTLTDAGQTLADADQTLANSDQDRPKLVIVGSSVKRLWPSLAETWPTAAKFCRMLADVFIKLGQHQPRLGMTSANVGRIWTESRLLEQPFKTGWARHNSNSTIMRSSHSLQPLKFRHKVPTYAM